MLREMLAKFFRPGIPMLKAVSLGTLISETPVAKLGDYQQYLQAGCKKVWASWKACDIIAKAVVDTTHIVRRKGSTDPVVVAPLDALLTAPNQFETLADLLYKSVLHVKLTGNAFWYKAEANLAGDRPLEIFGLNPKRMKVAVGKDGTPVGWLHKTRGVDVPFSLDEIIHFRQPHPDNDYYGLGEMEAAEPLFKDTLNRSNYGESFWKNGASPSGILILKEKVTDEEAWEKAKKKWQDQYSGAKNAGKTAWLTGEWSYQQLGLSAADMQDIEKSKLNDERIFLLHGVPLSVAGLREAANYATAEIDDQRFRAYTVKPMVKLFEDTMNTDLVAGFGDNLEIHFNVAGLVNLTQVVLNYNALFDRGIISVNEYRERVGLPSDQANPLWDQHFVSAGLVPLELAGIAQADQTQQAAAAIVNRQILAITDGRPVT